MPATNELRFIKHANKLFQGQPEAEVIAYAAAKVGLDLDTATKLYKKHQKFLKTNLNDGEHSAGLVVGEGGESSYYLILLPSMLEKNTPWKAGLAWAKSQGGDLPTPKEQTILFAKLRDQFAEMWYWSNMPHGDNKYWAFIQHFKSMEQYAADKVDAYAARAIRRLYVN